MDNATKMARAYLRGITTKKEFDAIVDKLFITDDERRVLIDIYAKCKPISVIADELGYSEHTIKNIHKRVLVKVSTLIYSNMQ